MLSIVREAIRKTLTQAGVPAEAIAHMHISQPSADSLYLHAGKAIVRDAIMSSHMASCQATIVASWLAWKPHAKPPTLKIVV
jgi:hypothetical protein